MSETKINDLENKILKKRKSSIDENINNLKDYIKNYRNSPENNFINTQAQSSSRNTTYNKSVNYNNYFKGNFNFKNNDKNRLKDVILMKDYIKNKKYIVTKKINDIRTNNIIKVQIQNPLLINKTYNNIFFPNNTFRSNFNNKSITVTNFNNKYNLKERYKKFANDINKNKHMNNFNTIIGKRKNHSTEVNRIVNTLLNSVNNESRRRYLKTITRKTVFPKEKTINPINYIKFNLQTNPYDKNLFKGISLVMKQLGNNQLKDNYESNLIKKASDINNLKIDNEHIEAPLNEALKYKKIYDNMINQTRSSKSFNFNRGEKYQKKEKMKEFKQYQNILDKNYRIYFNKKFGPSHDNLNQNKNDKNSNKIEQKESKRDVELENNLEKYISFDRRIDNILLVSKNTEDYVNEKSKEHEEMLNKINFLFNSYLK